MTMETTAASNETAQRGRWRGGRRRGNGNRRGRGGGQAGNQAADVTTATTTTTTTTTAASTSTSASDRQSPSSSSPEAPGSGSGDGGAQSSQSSQSSRARGRGRRGGRGPRGGPTAESRGGRFAGGRAFGAHLTAQPSGLSAAAPAFVPGAPAADEGDRITERSQQGSRAFIDHHSRHQAPTERVPDVVRPTAEKSTAEDLPTRIHEDISNYQYECVICTNEVLRTSRIWGCTVCWQVLHLSCVKKWHSKQMDINREKQDQDTPSAAWRCPYCNTTLTEEPGVHRCWCGKDVNPKFVAGLPPHSCGQTCSKLRGTCPHPCMLECHAGPCPPCQLQGPTQECFCGKSTVTRRCVETNYDKGWSCGKVCGDLMPCGEHECVQPCHSDVCGDCRVSVDARCYCGKVEKHMPCHSRDDPKESFYHGYEGSGSAPDKQMDTFEGCFDCGIDCQRLFSCGQHKCKQKCHPQDEEPAHCPLSPDVLLNCPCGKTPLSELVDSPRQLCTDPIPGCTQTCDKALPCGHKCPQTCHNGDCQPCAQIVHVLCRCGRPFSQELCLDVGPEPPICDRTCQVQMNCGRHSCPVKCCPGEKKATARLVAKRRNKGQQSTDDFEAEHICVRVCNKPLKCGSHTCPQICHKGACLTCLLAIFDEVSCGCGRTVLNPPLPCGTKPPNCHFPCPRVPSCGHPRVEHNCHLDDVGCPKCPFLKEKWCMCRKKKVRNQPCWLEDVRCGLPCGKKLKCGLHLCQKPCHREGECEDADMGASHCTQPCGKSRSICGHACVDRCHPSTPCKEDKPCQAKVFVTCPCQARKLEVKCCSSGANPHPRSSSEMLKCDDECLRLQRNQRLASALSIDPTAHIDSHIPYSDDTLAAYRENPTFGQAYEREFRVFAGDESERRLRFKPMPSHQRKFIHCLAADYGLDSESQDSEPQRHVYVFKTPRFVSAPRKTVGQCVRIRAAQLAVASKPAPVESSHQQQDPYNALLLTGLRFGITIDEVEAAIAKQTASIPSVVFFATYLPSDEIIVRANPKPTATTTAADIDAALLRIRPSAARDISRAGLATTVVLCHAEPSLRVTRREGLTDGNASDGGWNAVVGRAAQRSAKNGGGGGSSPSNGGQSNGAGNSSDGEHLVLRKLVGLKKKKIEIEEPVEEDWLAAANKLDEEERNGEEA